MLSFFVKIRQTSGQVFRKMKIPDWPETIGSGTNQTQWLFDAQHK